MSTEMAATQTTAQNPTQQTLAASAASAGTRERLLEAVAALSYQRGVGVGVDALCKAAGVSKRSLYQLFPTKDELLAASVERRAAQPSALIPPPDAALSPRERIMYVFERAEEIAAAPEYRGCPYLAVQVELKDGEHPASRAAARVKAEMQQYFEELARQGGAGDPQLVARQLILVFDGASARAGIGADTLDGHLASAMVATLLDAAGVH
jgi:AcrR family transcriptional regulator